MLSIATISLLLLGQHIIGFKFPNNNVTPEPTPEVRMLAVGDIMLDRAVASHMTKYDNDSILEQLAVSTPDTNSTQTFFEGYDLITGNLEGAVADYRRETTKSIAFNFTDESVNWLMDYGFNLVTLANNHSYDMGRAGFEETKKTLDEIGLDYYGEQYSVDEDALLFREINGINLAFIGVNDTNSYIDRDDLEPLLDRAEKEADYTIVNIHWGQEYKLLSNTHQKNLAYYMIDQGADLIIGHHPHVVQEIEIYNNRPIYYSLGNFIFDQYFSDDTQQGIGVEILFMEDSFSVRPHAFASRASKVRLMENENSDVFLKRIYENVSPDDLTDEFIINITK